MIENSPEAPKTKVSVNFYEKDLIDLEQLANQRRTTKTEALRGAIATEKWLRDRMEDGDTFWVREPGGNTLHKLVRVEEVDTPRSHIESIKSKIKSLLDRI